MDSSEYKALTKYYPELVSAIEQSPNEIAIQLKPSEILAKEDWSFLNSSTTSNNQKAQRIIDVVLNQVKLDPQVYNTFVGALKAAGPWINIVVRKLQDVHTSLSTSTPTKKKPDQTPSDGSTSSNNTQAVLTLSHSDSPGLTTRSLYQVVKEKPTTGEKTCLDESEGALERATTHMRHKFIGLISRVIASIRKARITVKEFVTFLQQIKSINAALTTAQYQCLLFTPQVLNIIETQCGDIDDIFRAIRDYYSWFNFDLVEDIIEAFCDNDVDVKENLSSYKALMRQYCSKRLCLLSDFLNEFDHKGNKLYVFKIDREWKTIRCSELEIIKNIICEILGLRKVTLFLRVITNGCVELSFDIPRHVANAVFPLSADQVEALKHKGIKYLDKTLINIGTATLADLDPQEAECEKISFTVRRRKNMPFEMGVTVQSVVIGDNVFVGGGSAFDKEVDSCTVIKYSIQRDEWAKLPKYNAKWFAMTSLDTQLVLVGGRDQGLRQKSTDQIALLVSGKWTHPYPPLNIPRDSSTAICFNNHLVVAGGSNENYIRFSSVEILNVSSPEMWYLTETLPIPLSSMKSALIGDTLYLMGGSVQKGDPTKMVLEVNLNDYIEKILGKQATPTLWHLVEDAPHNHSAPFSIGRFLFAVGGCDDSNNPNPSMYLYQLDTKKWEKVGELPTARYFSTCSTLPNGEVIVAGGQTGRISKYLDTVNFLAPTKSLCSLAMPISV